MNDKLLNAIQDAEDNSDKPELAEERAKALRYYNGSVDLADVEGRSNYVSRDVHNTIEGMKPSLLKIFASTDEVVKFEPQGPEDVEAAEQESAFCNYLLMQKNNGFLLLEQWFHDALLLKNGYVKAFWDSSEKVETERYAALTPDELAYIMQDPSVEVVSQEVNEFGLYSVEIQRKKEYGCVKVINLPPEQVLVDHNCPSVDLSEASFFEHWDYKPISWLRENGFKVSDDISDSTSNSESYEQWQRSTESLSQNYGDDLTNDPAMRMVKVRECWIRFDRNEDGKAELLHCIVVGNEILLEEEADEIPCASISPYPLPHRHIGRSVADDAMHYQEIKSFFWRNHIDSAAVALHPRFAISDRVNLSDMLVSRPGGIVRVEGEPNGSIMPLTAPYQGQGIQTIEFLASAQENDTGVTRYNQGLDANSLNKTATGIQSIMTAAQMRIDLIARNFAECGVKRLMWLIHKTAKQNYTQPEVMRLRNKWIPVDPRSWRTRYDMTISVGLGTGDKQQQLVHLQSILMAQKEALAIGVATPVNIYHALTKLTENAGFKDVNSFWTDPSEQPPAPPQPSPEEIKMQGQMQIEQMKLQADQQKFQAETVLKQQEAEKQLQQEMLRSQNDVEIERQKIEAQMELERWKAQLDAEVELAKTQMQVQAQQSMKEMEVTAAPQNPVNISTFDKDASTSLMDALNKLMEQQNASQEQLLAALTRPKKIIRGADGRAVGVE